MDEIKSDPGMLTREFQIRATDTEAREVTGIAVPWDTLTNIGGWYEEQFERGSVEDDGALLYWQHSEPIGKLLSARDTDKGREITAVISATPRGDEAMTLLRDGVITKFSIGFDPIEHRVDDETAVITRTKVLAREYSLVSFPAYEDAQVSQVRDRTQPKKEETVENTDSSGLVEVREEIQELSRRFDGFTPAVAATIDRRSAGAFVQALASGDTAALASYERAMSYKHDETQLRAYTGGTSADAPVMDAWVADLTRIFDGSSGVLAGIFSTGTLPATGMNIEYAQLLADTTAFTVQAAEGDDLAYGKVTLETKTAPVSTYGGYTQLTRAQIERSTLPVLNRSLEAMASAAGARKKVVLRTQVAATVAARIAIGSNAGVAVLGATLAAAAAGNWEDALIDAAIKYDGLNAVPEALVCSATVFKKLRSLTVSGERVFTVFAGNASGSLNLPGLTGNLSGIPVYLDAGQAGDSAYFANGDAIRQYDSSLVSLQDENIINLSKDFSVYRYGAIAAEMPQLIVPVKITAA
jgi:HK97 family phage prohead protease